MPQPKRKPAAKTAAKPAANTAATPDTQEDDRDARIAELEAQLAAAGGARGGRRDEGKVRVDLADLDQDARAEHYSDWPSRDGDLPQPWDHRALNLTNAERDHLDQTKAGAANTVSPIVVSHGKPVLTSGSSDSSVQELGRILGELGFPNSVSDGDNPFGIVDNSVMRAVYAFRDAYGVQEDPSGFGGDTPSGRELAAAHIGAWTWEAVLRAGELQTA